MTKLASFCKELLQLAENQINTALTQEDTATLVSKLRQDGVTEFKVHPQSNPIKGLQRGIAAFEDYLANNADGTLGVMVGSLPYIGAKDINENSFNARARGLARILNGSKPFALLNVFSHYRAANKKSDEDDSVVSITENKALINGLCRKYSTLHQLQLVKAVDIEPQTFVRGLAGMYYFARLGDTLWGFFIKCDIDEEGRTVVTIGGDVLGEDKESEVTASLRYMKDKVDELSDSTTLDKLIRKHVGVKIALAAA